MIDPSFRNINNLFVLSFKNSGNDPTRNSFVKYCMPSVEIRDYNALIYNKSFFDQRVKNKQDAHEKLFEMSRSNDYTAGNFLDYLYCESYYKLISSAFSRQANTSIHQQINFTGKLAENDGATMFIIAQKQQVH